MPVHEIAYFERLLDRIRVHRIQRWSSIEEAFIDAIERFDSKYAAGGQTTGWYQAKARYFNDIIVELLSNTANQPIELRSKKDSQLFEKIDIDICYPSNGNPIVAGEVKALGTPPHPGNNEVAREARKDIHKRVREVAFTSTDLKAAYAPPRPIRSFQEWIDSTTPGYFAFWAIRANDQTDLNGIRTTLTSLRAYCNGVGAVIYEPRSPSTPTRYEVHALRELSIDRALREMAQRIS